MNSRPLNKTESAQLTRLSDAGLDTSLIFLTATGLKKSILDATTPVRELLQQCGVHDYEVQGQGEQHKRILRSNVYDATGTSNHVDVAFYRPVTKKGDPRLWIYSLRRFAKPDEVLAVFCHVGELFFVNLSAEMPISFTSPETEFDRFLSDLRRDYNRNSMELLAKLRSLAAVGPIKAVCCGDTAIGRTLETALGISINSRKNPDYKGIEIKAKRVSSSTRSNLFAQVPNWQLSEFKSAAEMLDRIGYATTENIRKLYCTVSATSENSQGLILKLQLDQKRLNELWNVMNRLSDVCVWELEKLHQRLHDKHAETFWVAAREHTHNGQQYFTLDHVKHTRKPSAKQFDRLLGSGEITVDHLIKRSENGRVTEKGPLFKIRPSAINELFLGVPQEYDLSIHAV